MNNTMKLVERLTAIFPPHGTLAFEAADAIETLTQRVKCLEEALEYTREELMGAHHDLTHGFNPHDGDVCARTLERVMEKARTTLANQGGEKSPSPKEE